MKGKAQEAPGSPPPIVVQADVGLLLNKDMVMVGKRANFAK